MNLATVFQVAALPTMQNSMYSTLEEAMACPTGDVRLVQDQKTGIVFNAAFNPEKVVYDQKYQNEQGCSAFFSRHLQAVARIIEKYSYDKTLLEVGCGKGGHSQNCCVPGI